MTRAFAIFVWLSVLATGCAGDESNGRGGSHSSGGHDTSVAADIGFGEAVDKDAAQPDATAPDGASPDAAAPDVAATDVAGVDLPWGDDLPAVPDAGGPDQPTAPDVQACSDKCEQAGWSECVGVAAYRVCQPVGECLEWTNSIPCPVDETCEDGDCVKGQPPDCTGVPNGCDQPGARKCSDDHLKVLECSTDQCPAWTTHATCGADTQCLAGQCVGGSVCAALQACVDTSCAAEAESGSDISLAGCTLQHCKDEYEACMGAWGTGTCKEILTCVMSCQTSNCMEDCLHVGSYDADVTFVEVGTCLEQNCPTALQDPMSNLSCIMGSCSSQLDTCCGGMMNCLM